MLVPRRELSSFHTPQRHPVSAQSDHGDDSDLSVEGLSVSNCLVRISQGPRSGRDLEGQEPFARREHSQARHQVLS